MEFVYSPPRPRYCFDSHKIVRYIKFDPKVLYKSLDFFFFLKIIINEKEVNNVEIRVFQRVLVQLNI